MTFNHLSEWLSWLEQLHPKKIDLGLERVHGVAAELGLLKPRAKVITVAGTNGKGSCVATLSALLVAKGTSVGCYTSPHLLRYEERIQINGVPVDATEIMASFERINQHRGSTSLSYFEFGTLAALDIFQRREVEFMLLEVGLGGRLDATNIIDADVAIVTSIAMDHQQWLGSDREQIGREKAGIFRAGTPALCADHQAPESIKQVADEMGALLKLPGADFQWEKLPTGQWTWQGSRKGSSQDKENQGEALELAHLPMPRLPLPSVAVALQALTELQSLPEESVIRQVLPTLELAGRLQRVKYRDVEVVFDVAHNPAAAERLAAFLQQGDYPSIGVVAGVMEDKDTLGMFRPLKGIVDYWWTADLPTAPRGAAAEKVQEDLATLGVSAVAVETPMTAFDEAVKTVSARGCVVVFGSFYTVAHVMSRMVP